MGQTAKKFGSPLSAPPSSPLEPPEPPDPLDGQASAQFAGQQPPLHVWIVTGKRMPGQLQPMPGQSSSVEHCMPEEQVAPAPPEPPEPPPLLSLPQEAAPEPMTIAATNRRADQPAKAV